MTDGLLVVDKPAGLTSHDVVARVRRLAGTRRVGHAGTLDPGATGVLVVGVGRATRLLGHLALHDKAYDAVFRLGVATSTDDADGEVLSTADASGLAEATVRGELARWVGDVDQVPSSVSAISIGGRRAYQLVRAGERPELAPRAVHVTELTMRELRPRGPVLELDVHVECSTGTYVRALARDIGAALGVGGSLGALRRTRVGPFPLAAARTLEQLTESLQVLPLADAVAAAFPRREVSETEAARLVHGGRLAPVGLAPGPVGAFAPDGTVLALLEERDGVARPLVVFA